MGDELWRMLFRGWLCEVGGRAAEWGESWREAGGRYTGVAARAGRPTINTAHAPGRTLTQHRRGRPTTSHRPDPASAAAAKHALPLLRPGHSLLCCLCLLSGFCTVCWKLHLASPDQPTLTHHTHDVANTAPTLTVYLPLHGRTAFWYFSCCV